MNKRLFVAGIAALAVSLGAVVARGAASEETVSLDKVPAKVRATIEKHAEGAKIQKVELITDEQGKKVYDVEIQKGGKTTEFSVSPEGKYLGVKTDEDEEKGEAGEKKGKTSDFVSAADVNKANTKLPDSVTKTFKKTFPKGEIDKLDVDEENGVTVYDIEFKDGAIEKETDITADGTMLEFTVVIDAKEVPTAAMKAVKKGAKGATLGRIERIEISYETKDGKAIKLPKPITRYAVEIAKGDQTTEIVVTPDGTAVEPEKSAAKEPKTAAGKTTDEAKGKSSALPGVEPKTRPWDQVPSAVQATILANGGKAGPVDKERKLIDGKAVYEAPAKDKNGNMVDLVVLEDGKLVEVKTDAASDFAKDQAAKQATPEAKGAKGGKKAAKKAKGEPVEKDGKIDGFASTFDVDKANLTNVGKNPYFIPLQPGYRLYLEGGGLTLKVTVLDETKLVDGVECRIVEEREEKDGKPIEVSRNYFAIDKTTNDVYYFGEDAGGAWLSGVDGARFGMIMPGKPKVGDKFQQEVAPKVAMDRCEIVATSEEFKTPAGTLKDCLRIKETTPLESGVGEKVYARGVGLVKDDECVLVKIEKAGAKKSKAGKAK